MTTKNVIQILQLTYYFTVELVYCRNNDDKNCHANSTVNLLDYCRINLL